jgi:sugar lactone lactonase YvrE
MNTPMQTRSTDGLATPCTLLTGLGFGESARWHDGRLWLANWDTQQIIAVDLESRNEIVLNVPTTLPLSFDWLPDGRILIVSGPEGFLMRREPDGSLVQQRRPQTPPSLAPSPPLS